MILRKLYLILSLLFFYAIVVAQTTNSNLRLKKIPITSTPFFFNNYSIVPHSFCVINIPDSLYKVDELDASITWLKIPSQDSVYIKFRTLAVKLNKKYQHLNFEDIRYRFLNNQIVISNDDNEENANSIIHFKGLQSEGSFGRSLSFGNNQDAALSSSMNFQISGIIGDSLQLLAAISDNNIPIQPDGNTKDLRDFDRVLLQIKKNNWQLSFGDLDTKENEKYFLKFNKRIQGISFSTENDIYKDVKNRFAISGAIAKGKFSRNQITSLEGNQGPYKLQGVNNELYFVVLAGTERVFIDGELLQRGETEDYTINYNTAELTFTPKRIITKDSRITVEFQYADRNYLNTQLFISDEVKLKEKLVVSFSAYSNKDSKNSMIDQELDANQKYFLSTIGDSIQNAFINNEVRDTFSIGKILYQKIDTVYNGNIHDSIYVQSSNSNLNLYKVTFTYVGQGKGNYKLSLKGNNGKFYEWVQPLNANQKQGDFEPVSFLVTPKKQQVFDLALKFTISKRTKIATEWALSNYDVNLFSTKNKEDNYGYAGKIIINNQSRDFSLSNKMHHLNIDASYEKVKKEFNPIERIRSIEFYRNWNMTNDFKPSDESLSNLSLNLISESGNYLQYQFLNFKRNEGYNGIQHILNHCYKINQWTFSESINQTYFNQTNTKGNFFRPSLSFTKSFNRLNNYQIGGNFITEKNVLIRQFNDSLLTGSNAFYKIEGFIKSDSLKLTKWKLSYFNRVDYLPFENQLLKSNESNNYTLNASIDNGINHQINISANFRDLHSHNSNLTNIKDDKTLLGRVDYNFSMIKGFIKGNIFYELGTGQEQKREFSYLSVPVGQGEYTWIDYNNNGIEELNEFENAVFQDQKKYIRIYTPTNNYIKANFLQLNYSIELSPDQLIQSKSNLLNKILSRINSNSILQINKKTIADNQFQFNPFDRYINDTALIFNNANYSNALFYNRTSLKWGFELFQNKTENRTLLTYGIEERNINSFSGKIRVNLNQNLVSSFSIKNTNNSLFTGNSKFYNRNYKIEQLNYEPSLSYFYKSKWRVTLAYILTTKKNAIDSLEQTISHSLNGEFKYNLYSNTSISLNGSYSQINFNAYPGAANTTVGYALLEGLVPGKNYLWNINILKRFSGNIELNIQYEGRKSENSKLINIGRASIRALF